MKNKINLITQLELNNKLLGEVNSKEEWDWLHSEIADITSQIFFSKLNTGASQNAF